MFYRPFSDGISRLLDWNMNVGVFTRKEGVTQTRARRDVVMKISRRTLGLTRDPRTTPRVLVSSGDLRDYLAVTAMLAGSPDSQDGSLGHGTTREITNSPP